MQSTRALPNTHANGRKAQYSLSSRTQSSSAAARPVPSRPLPSATPPRGRSRSPSLTLSSRSRSQEQLQDVGQLAGQKRRRVEGSEAEYDEDRSARKSPHLENIEDDARDSPPLIDEPYWEAKGKILGRCVEMWDSFNLILDEGISRDPAKDVTLLRTPMQNERYKTFRQLIEVAPALLSVLESAGSDLGPVLTKRLHTLIDKGRKAARREDVNGLKEEIGKWSRIQWEPAFPHLRHLQGFQHETTGGFLVPIGEDWEDQRVRDRYRSGKVRVGADDYPAFLWPKGMYDAEDMFKNVLRGELIELGYLHIFICPSAAKDGVRSTRPGNAALHDIAFVTYESICYVATIIRYALSDEQKFTAGNVKDPKSFPYRDFYRELLDLRSHMSIEEVNDLLDWWNEKIFPSSVYTPRKKNPNSVAAKMRAQARSKRIAYEKEAAEHVENGLD